jgi:hypothetical protein
MAVNSLLCETSSNFQAMYKHSIADKAKNGRAILPKYDFMAKICAQSWMDYFIYFYLYLLSCL